VQIILIGILLVLLALFGEPLFIIIGAIALLSFAGDGQDLAVVIASLSRIADAPALLAIPLFTFAGYLLAESNAPKRLLNLSQSIFGRLPGGLTIVSLLACAIFTAFTGGSGITIVALGGLILPMLLKEKYPEKFSLGIMTTCGSLGILFPPSLPIILYALIAQQSSQQVSSLGIDSSVQMISVNKLFIAGIVPGVLLIVLLSIYGIYRSRKLHLAYIPSSFKRVKDALKESIWEIPLPFIIIFGIYWGIFTATEAAAITAFYVFIIEVFIYRDLNLFKDLPRVIKESMMLVGAILVILGCALGLTDYLIFTEVPQKLFTFIQAYVSSQFVFLILLNLFLLIVGMMMDIFSAIIVVVPIIVPIALNYGIDPVHLGIIFLLNLEIGYLTPPVGVNLFISSFRFEKPIVNIYRAVLPFIGIMLIALILVTYIPDFSLLLINLFKIQ
jgi:tripartite ATP-independent transporter DctM subunit